MSGCTREVEVEEGCVLGGEGVVGDGYLATAISQAGQVLRLSVIHLGRYLAAGKDWKKSECTGVRQDLTNLHSQLGTCSPWGQRVSQNLSEEQRLWGGWLLPLTEMTELLNSVSRKWHTRGRDGGKVSVIQ